MYAINDKGADWLENHSGGWYVKDSVVLNKMNTFYDLAIKKQPIYRLSVLKQKRYEL